MKVNKITPQPGFQPVTLQITIESQEELELLKELFRVPKLLKESGHISVHQEDLMDEMMSDLVEVL